MRRDAGQQIFRRVVILMADDDEDDRMLVKGAFGTAHIPSEFHFAEDGEDLLNYLRRHGKYADNTEDEVDRLPCPRPDIILLDLNMPKISGREALREIKTDPELRRIPTIVFTTSKAPEDIVRCYEMGANSFICKPASYDDLVTLARAISVCWIEAAALSGEEHAGIGLN